MNLRVFSPEKKGAIDAGREKREGVSDITVGIDGKVMKFKNRTELATWAAEQNDPDVSE